MKTMLQKQVYSTIRNIVALTFIITVCSGITRSRFNCSSYTFHENSTSSKDRNWEQSRELCQNSSEGDLVSIEEEEERIYLRKIIKNLKAIKYYIGLKKERGEWMWLSGNSVHASKGKHPWSPGEPNGNSHTNCATIYGNYKTHFDGFFDDLSCSKCEKDAGYICERAEPCTKERKAELTTIYKDTKRPSTTQSSPVSSTTQSEMTTTQPRETTHLERADESSFLITIIVSVLGFVILGISIALWFVFVYRPRKKGSKSTIQQDKRQRNSTELRRNGGLSPAKQEMDDYESLPEVKRQDTCVRIEEGHRGSFLSMPQSSTKGREKACIKKQSSTDGYCNPLNISATTKTSNAFVKKDNLEQYHVYAIVHINPKEDKAEFHSDTVMQDLDECPSRLRVKEENCKPIVGLSTVGHKKELTRNEEAIVKENASGQDQCNDCVYAAVDKEKTTTPKKPAPYHNHVYTDIDHINSSATNDSRLWQENEVKLI